MQEQLKILLESQISNLNTLEGDYQRSIEVREEILNLLKKEIR